MATRFYVDSKNVGSAPDGLRAEIGRYWEIIEVNEDRILDDTESFKSHKLDDNKTQISNRQVDQNTLFPRVSQKILIVGHENQFHDHAHWKEFVKSKIKTDVNYSDHYFVYNDNAQLEFNVHNNYHHPAYEDLTKSNETNHLLNINFMNYANNVNAGSFIRNASGFLTSYDLDDDDRVPSSANQIKELYDTYGGRFQNYTGSMTELNIKQRNIFILEQDKHVSSIDELKEACPYFLEVNYSNSTLNQTDMFSDQKQTKHILQSLKGNVGYLDLSFYRDADIVKAKVHNLTSLILNYDSRVFNESDDETFLLIEDDLQTNSISNRFINQIRKIKMLASLQTTLRNQMRDYAQTISRIGTLGRDSRKYNLGFKVEKYLDNDATLPIQTYYTTSLSNFYDTQLKFGRRYIYKVYCLEMVIGSSYEYSDLGISQADSQLYLEDDTTVLSSPAFNVSDKYRAEVSVTVSPSLQVIEIPVDTFETTFFDEPPPVPEVMFYNESGKKNSLKMYIQSNLNELYDKETEFVQILDTDSDIAENLRLSADSVYGTTFTNKYAIGAFEIYRMDREPTSLSDFRDNYLTTVDHNSTIVASTPGTTIEVPNPFYNPNNSSGFQSTIFLNTPGAKYFKPQEDLNAFFEDQIVPHRKYYYLFRALTYHDTPSNPTIIYEIELIQDSDETRIVVSEFVFKEEKDYDYKKPMKRFMKIEPNFEHLLFNHDGTIGFLDNNLLLPPPRQRKFKFRITSRHTGKKMDINVIMKLSDET